MKIQSIAFIIPYFGKWPLWFPAFLKSCQANPSIDWLFITDCDTNIDKPDNVVFCESSLNAIKDLAESKLNCSIALTTPRKLCDLRPAYGYIFQEYIAEYDFWGFCDVDIIWGNIRKFITPELLGTYDIVSSRKFNISGHFTLLRNTSIVNSFFKTIPGYINLLAKKRYMWGEEHKLSEHIRQLQAAGQLPFTIYWEPELLENGISSVPRMEYYLDRFQFKDGAVFQIWPNGKTKEYMYFHFINWKIRMTRCEVTLADKEHSFLISYSGMHYRPHSKWQHQLNSFKNIINGYWVKDKRRVQKHKLKSFFSRVQRKLQLIE